MENKHGSITIDVEESKKDKSSPYMPTKIAIDFNAKCIDKWSHIKTDQVYKESFRKLWNLFLQDPWYKWWLYVSSFFGFFFSWTFHKGGHFWKEIESLSSALDVDPIQLYYFQFWIETNYNLLTYHSIEDRSIYLVDWEMESKTPNFVIVEISDEDNLMVRGYTFPGSVGVFHGYIDAIYYANIQLQKRASIPNIFSMKKGPSLCYSLRKALEDYTSVENFSEHFCQSASYWAPFYLYVYDSVKRQKVLIQKSGALETCIFSASFQSFYHSGYLKDINLEKGRNKNLFQRPR